MCIGGLWKESTADYSLFVISLSFKAQRDDTLLVLNMERRPLETGEG
jgi:hypothetical protein